MKPIKHGLPAIAALTVLQLSMMQAFAAPLTLSNTPLFLTTGNKANVLMMYGNSNSMDSDATGAAVGSAAATSKSEIARKAIIGLIDGYTGYINMGLMAYQQHVPVKKYLHDAQYDVSYKESDWVPTFAGARNSQTKKFRVMVDGRAVYYNINLPSYSNAASERLFCYSTQACTDTTHDFMGKRTDCSQREVLPVGASGSGPWDSYACYRNKEGDSNALEAAAYSAHQFSTELVPTDSDLGQSITDFGKRLTQQYVSESWLNNAAPGPGYLHVPIALLDSTQGDKLKKKLATSQFVTNAPTDPNQPLQNSGLSPLAGTVDTANTYFANALTNPDQGGTTPARTVPNSCRKNFLVTLTDGLPSVFANGTASADTTGMLAELTTRVAALKSSVAQAETYVVGFALPYGVSVTQLDTIAAAGGSGTAYYADNPATLDTAFRRIFADIIAKTSAASSVALNSQSVVTGANVFQARFSSGDWSGQLLKFAFVDATVGSGAAARTVKVLDQSTALWDAGARVTAQSLPTAGSTDGRTIITRKSNNTGIAFRWPATGETGPAALDTAQINALNKNAAGVADGNGAARLAYLRGSAANEGTAGLKFRSRPTSKLGDIVNSAPVYVGDPELNYGLAGYAAFRRAKASRPEMLYVGANDGMLHGFDLATGDERLAYVPTALFGKLSKLTGANYLHEYYVDGSPSVGDVEIGGAWRTMLVSGMGNGARGVFGLDVTDPGAFTEAGAASVVKFEKTADPDLGFISGPIGVVKLNNGKWAAVFGNGLNSAGNSGNGDAYLFLLDVADGSLIAKIKADSSPPRGETDERPNGLSAPLLIDEDGNDTVDVAYAGDLRGNLWKFNLRSATDSLWEASYKLFTADKPITSMPDAGEHPDGGYMVYFGTGKYLEAADVLAPAATTSDHAMYGVRDTGAAVAAGDLVDQSFSTLGTRFRTASNNAVNYAEKKGWKMVFPSKAERVVSPPQLRDGRVIFTSIIPSNAECTPGGSSYLNQLNWLTGGILSDAQFDTNGDYRVDTSDDIAASEAVDGVASPPAIQSMVEFEEANLLNGSKGVVELVRGAGNAKRSRRLTWRQLKK